MCGAPKCPEFCGKAFREAVNYLLEFNGKRSRDSPALRPKPAQQEEKPVFALPIANGDQRWVFAYLQKRGIATTKEPEGKRSKCNSGGKSNTPELPDFSGHPGDRRIASLLRL